MIYSSSRVASLLKILKNTYLFPRNDVPRFGQISPQFPSHQSLVAMAAAPPVITVLPAFYANWSTSRQNGGKSRIHHRGCQHRKCHGPFWRAVLFWNGPTTKWISWWENIYNTSIISFILNRQPFLGTSPTINYNILPKLVVNLNNYPKKIIFQIL